MPVNNNYLVVQLQIPDTIHPEIAELMTNEVADQILNHVGSLTTEELCPQLDGTSLEIDFHVGVPTETLRQIIENA